MVMIVNKAAKAKSRFYGFVGATFFMFFLMVISVYWNGDSMKAFAAGTSYYVDSTNGNDMNSGTSPSNAWQSLSKINSTTFQPGDQLLFSKGGVWSGQLHPLGSGSSGNPITIDAYGTGNRPVINGGGIAGATVHLSNQSYWFIQNLEVTNIDTSNTNALRYGIYAESKNGGTINGIHILDNFVHDVSGSYGGTPTDPHINGGISVHAVQTNDSLHDVVVQGNTVTNVSKTGIVVWDESWSLQTNASTNVVVKGNVVTNTEGDSILLFGTDGALIERNVASFSGLSYGCNAGIWPTRAFNTIMQFNESYSSVASCDGQGFDSDLNTINTTIQYNYSHDNVGGFLLLCGQSSDTAIVRYNISQNDAGHGAVSFGCNMTTNVQVYNNTFYFAPGQGGKIIDNYGGITGSVPYYFTNNIFYNLGTADYSYPGTGGVFDHNVFYGNHPSNEPSDANKLTSNPLLANPGSGGIGMNSVDGYKLLNNSPALLSGALISGNGGKDYWGNAVSQTAAPNRGAYNGTGVASAGVVLNADFESGSLSPWTNSNAASIVGSNVHSGSYALQIGASVTGVEQVIAGLQPNTTYALTGWIKNANAGDATYLGVKNHGGPETNQAITGSSYSQAAITFTTGSANTTATVYIWKGSGTSSSFVDDIQLVKSVIQNDGFETGSLSPWTTANGASVVSTNAHSGSYALRTGASNSAAEQVITGLQPNTTYALTGWIKNANAGDAAYLGVKNFGGSETNQAVTGSSYSQTAVTFTTGPTDTTATVYIRKDAGTAFSYADDIQLVKGFVRNAGFETGYLSPWTKATLVSVVGSNAHSGSHALQTDASDSGVEQVISGLQPNTTYTLTGWIKNTNAGDVTYLGVKHYGGPETNQTITSSSYSRAAVTFTTGSNNTTATIYVWKNAGTAPSFADDIQIVKSIVRNAGFETGNLSPWTNSNGASVVGTTVHSGSYALQIGANNTGAEQVVTGLQPNTTYALTGWIKNTNAGDAAYLGVKNHGGPETNQAIAGSSYAQASITFTTGSTNTTALIYIWKSGGTASSYADDIQLVAP